MSLKKMWSILGPVCLSAFSIFVTFQIVQPITNLFDPSFNLLANRGVGKIAFMTIVIAHIFLLLFTSRQTLLKIFLEKNIYFFSRSSWIKSFFSYFLLFSTLHVVLLLTLVALGIVQFDPTGLNFSLSLAGSILLGFVATFFLAWSEELIFRGTLYLYWAQDWSPLVSALITSVIFSLVHDLLNPINLMTRDWQLGLGLFLLGFLLNLIFIVSGKLYTGMGAHAGLVFVKVLLRRMPIITYPSAEAMPWWVHQDLRQSPLVHTLFFLVIIGILVAYKRRITEK